VGRRVTHAAPPSLVAAMAQARELGHALVCTIDDRVAVILPEPIDGREEQTAAIARVARQLTCDCEQCSKETASK
jgi:hypothetical protein